MRISSDQRAFERSLRRSQTDAERRIWSRLRGGRLWGCKFRRQFPIGPYYGDFVCLEIGLVVELDGGQHNDERHRRSDAIRRDLLVKRGFEVLRFWDNDVMRDTDAIIAVIAQRIEALTRAAPDLSPAWRER